MANYNKTPVSYNHARVFISVSDNLLRSLLEESLAGSFASTFRLYASQVFDESTFSPSDTESPFILVCDQAQLKRKADLIHHQPKGLSEALAVVIQNGDEGTIPLYGAFKSVKLVGGLPNLRQVVQQVKAEVHAGSIQFARESLNLSAKKIAEQLSPRELEVLELVVQGFNIQEISERLDIAGPTTKIHKGKIMSKSKCKSLRELILLFGPRYLTDERLIR